MKLKYTGLAIAMIVAGLNPALAEPNTPEPSVDQASLSFLLAYNLEQYHDCGALEPLEAKVRAEIDKLPTIGVLDTIEAMQLLSSESPCANLKQYALEAHDLAFTDRELFIVKMGLGGSLADDESEKRPEGKGSGSFFLTSGVPGSDNPPPMSAGQSTTSDYQQ